MADTLFINGAIRTLDKSNPEASFIAVKDGKIIAVGNNSEEVAKFTEEGKTQTVDLHGKSVLPGFVESHNHFNAVAGQWGWVDVGIRNCANIPQVLDTIKQAAQKTRQDYEQSDPKPENLPWIKCVGFDDTLVEESRDLLKDELDSVSQDLPVWIWHPSLHRVYVNSKALEISGIDDSVVDPEGGKFVRDANGHLTGQMEEMAAYQKVYLHLNKTIDPRNKGRDMWETARYFASRGVTSVQDLFVGPMLFMLYKNAFQTHTKENPFPIRVTLYSPPWEDRPAETGFDQDFLRFAGTKLFADGSIQCHTACCSQPYLDEPEAKGILTIPAPQLKQAVLKFQSIGRQIAIHCNGDEAIELFIQAVENAQATIPREGLRHRIEHCQLVSDDQLARMKKAGICVSFFIGHVYYWGDRHRNIFLGEDRARRISPLNSALKAEVPFALHCDCPVTPVDPLHSIWISSARLTKSNYELGPEQKISVEQAIRAYTIDGAYLAFEENLKGSLEVGKFADFIVLSQDPLAVPVNDIPSIQIEHTYVGGRVVYSNPANA